ncbi:MAG: type II secretion system F family protein [Verrucomicrobia bacterium]|nr:type II secretion system F family protein [Verrucomicrobiota bacterium]MBU1733817.1 type II secretion system F family protein [Verrucomicrobiota bacterium]MBU1856357.1 type II secretion system F family protein [Verrucomicrobiota bacterium]
MPKYRYTAADAQGKEKSGILDVASKPAALVKLRELGLHPSSVEEVLAAAAVPRRASSSAQRAGARGNSGVNVNLSIPLPKFLRRRVKRKQLATFTRQLATLIDARVPLLRALQILQKQEQSTGLREIIGELCEAVEGGSTFTEALSQHPKVFDRLFINMVKAGEIGGVLQVTLNRLTEFVEKAEKIKTRVKGAMIYPIVVLVMALGITGVLMVLIIPKFTEIFKELLAGKEMPAITQFVIAVSNTLVNRFPVVIGGIVAAVVLVKLVGRTRFGRYQLDKLMLGAPIFGALTMRVSVSRFARTLGTLLSSGVQILQALTIVRETAGNEVIARAVQTVHDSIKEGETMAAPLEASRVFPSMVVSMIAVGEETGRLPDMLVKIADTYDTEVDAAVDGLTSIIEPVLIIFLAVVVGTIVIAMFMPLVSIISNLK